MIGVTRKSSQLSSRCLNCFRDWGSWDYLHRSCATAAELKYRLETEWCEYCNKGSVLYFLLTVLPTRSGFKTTRESGC